MSTSVDRRRRVSFSFALIAVSLLFAFFLSTTHAAVFSIDYGTDWYKVALVKGKSLDIALNADSKRKTEATVNVRDQKRVFGSEAKNLETRYPVDSYPALKPLLGRKYSDLHAEAYRSIFRNSMREDPKRGTVAFAHQEGDKDVTLTVEELVAMQFTHAKEMAERTAKERLKDVVITVPPYFNQFERQAVLDAAEIAGLHVLQLMHDNTAVALNYAMTRTTSKQTHHIFYDSGAGSTVASLVSFGNTEVFYDSSNKQIPTSNGSKYNKTISEIELRSVGYDRTLGGNEIDLRLQKWLAEEFTKKHGKETTQVITSNERAMMKLLKEAKRVKIVLSVNTETTSSVEGLLDNIDFKTKITREILESLCTDVFDRATGPLDTVLKGAGITAADIESLVLVGGNVRVPAIQEALRKYIGAEKIAKNVNGDEAAALGAAFRAAGLSRQFSVPKEIRIKEINSYPIEVKYDAEKKSENDEPRVIRTTLFKEKAHFGSRKMMNFKKSDDFVFDAAYTGVDEKVFGPSDLYQVAVSGLTAAVEKYKNVTVEDPKVKVTMLLSDSGMLVIENGVVVIETEVPENNEPKDGSLKGKIMSFFGSEDAKNASDDAEAKVDETPVADEISGTGQQVVFKTPEETTESAEKEKKDGQDAKANVDTKPKRTTEKITLALSVEPRGVEPMGAEAKKEAMQRQSEMDDVDRIIKARDEARNTLEAYIYRIREWLDEDLVLEVSTEQQRDELRSKLSSESAWLYQDGDQAEEKDYVERLKDLRVLEEPIAKRHSEFTQRPISIQTLRDLLAKARSLLSDKPWSVPELHRSVRDWKKFPTVDLTPLTDLVKETEEWLSSMEIAQSVKSLFEDAVFDTRDIENKGRLVQAAFDKVLAKAKDVVLRNAKAEKDKKEKERLEKAKMEKEKEQKKKKEEKADEKKTEEGKTEEASVTDEALEESKVQDKEEKDAETANEHIKDEL